MAKLPDGFVALSSLRHGPPDPAAALSEIRRLYFRTSRQTIDADFAHAIELLKALPSEEDRERATVFMDGLNEMRREWQKAPAKDRAGKPKGAGAASRGGKARGKTTTGGASKEGTPKAAGAARSRAESGGTKGGTPKGTAGKARPAEPRSGRRR